MNISHRTSFYTIIPKEDRCVNAPTQETEQVQSGEEAGKKKKRQGRMFKRKNPSRNMLECLTSHLIKSTRGRSFGFE